MVKDIQGHSPNLRLGPAAIVYVALAYIVNQTTSVKDAFFVGMATYAVYDFTNLSFFDNYSPYVAVADTLWGGVLMASVRYLLNMI